MAFLTALGSIALLLSEGGKPRKDERVSIFSDSLNHASIIDGIRLTEKQGGAVSYVYRHCDMFHLDALLTNCTMKKKVVVTDSLNGVLKLNKPGKKLACKLNDMGMEKGVLGLILIQKQVE